VVNPGIEHAFPHEPFATHAYPAFVQVACVVRAAFVQTEAPQSAEVVRVAVLLDE
jgi:hypothetical protein